MKKYFSDIWDSIFSVVQGMQLTLKHLKNAQNRHLPTNVTDKNYFLQSEGLVTLTYPYETLPVPEIGRYKLHNEIDDCIVCDKCAVICPVNCIAIDAIKSSEPIGITSDGSVKRLYAAKFDIDMAKCCFCGLCTSVCPTECLTMTNEYDFSTFTVKEMNFEFADLSPEQADEKRKLYAQFVHEKELVKKAAAENSQKDEKQTDIGEIKKPHIIGVKPPFKPMVKPPTIIAQPTTEPEDIGEAIPKIPVIKKPMGIKPVFKPVIKTDTNLPNQEN